MRPGAEGVSSVVRAEGGSDNTAPPSSRTASHEGFSLYWRNGCDERRSARHFRWRGGTYAEPCEVHAEELLWWCWSHSVLL